ncbi:hypothetical protein WCLP8_4000009 [uncultured Gammaproteobacteria bacterium]
MAEAFDSATGAGLAGFDAEGGLRWANPAFRVCFGFSEQMPPLGLPLAELLTLIINGNEIQAHCAALLRGEPVEHPLANGRWGTLSLGQMPADGGQVLTVVPHSATRTREELLRTTLEHLSQGVSVIDGELRYIGWNRRFLDLLALPDHLVQVGKSMADTLRHNAERGEYGPGDIDALVGERVERAKLHLPHVFERQRPDGRTIEISGTPLPGGGFVSTYTDVTQRRAEEQLLKDLAENLEQRVNERTAELIEERTLLATTLEAMSDGIAVFDEPHTLVLWNQNFSDILGFEPELIKIGTPYERLVSDAARRGLIGGGEVKSLVNEQVKRAHSRERMGYHLRTENGTQVIQVRHVPLPDGGFLRTYTDVTAQVRGEEAQRQLLEAIAFPLMVSRRRDGIVLFANQPALELLGETRDSQIGRQARNYYADPADRDRLYALLDDRGQVDDFEARLLIGEGLPLWVMMSLRRFDYQGDEAMLTCLNVIDERKRAEQELASQWAQTRTVLESIGQGLTAFDSELRLVAWNQRFQDLLGFPRDFAYYHQPFSDYIRFNARRGEYGPGDVEEIIAAHIERARRFHPHRFERVRPGGTVIEVQGQVMPGGGFVTTYTNITERKRAEEAVRSAKEQAEAALGDLQEAQTQLIQSEKMAALGSLVAGIAHEINTPIGVTLTGASLLADKANELRTLFVANQMRRSDLADYLEATTETTELMLANIRRAAELIQSFKQVAVDQTSEVRRRFGLRAYIYEVLRSLGVNLKKTPHKVTVRCPDSLEIDGYPGAISQILTNFIMNSLNHAFDPGQAGQLSITVTLSTPEMPTPEMPASEMPAPEIVELRYGDDGRGIPAQHCSRVFEPFFTTARGSGGSGLGLHVVYNIVTHTLKGTITLDSTEGRGTTFTVRFPRTAA